jgi:hypothetical protein
MSEGKRQIPSVGRVVHYVAYGTPGGEYQAGAHRAAIITEVFFMPLPDIEEAGTGPHTSEINPEIASLCVLNPTGMFFKDSLPYDPTGTIPGSWHWPEFVPAK